MRNPPVPPRSSAAGSSSSHNTDALAICGRCHHEGCRHHAEMPGGVAFCHFPLAGIGVLCCCPAFEPSRARSSYPKDDSTGARTCRACGSRCRVQLRGDGSAEWCDDTGRSHVSLQCPDMGLWQDLNAVATREVRSERALRQQLPLPGVTL